MPEKLLVTGASGFVGRRLLGVLRERRRDAVGVYRSPPSGLGAQAVMQVPGIDDKTRWLVDELRPFDAVVHLAARVHAGRSEPGDDELHRLVNLEGTLNLARQAAAAGVRRFVFVSSIKVNGEQTEPGRPFTAQDPPRPADAYARSKHEAEQALLELASRSAMEVVVVRPVLVYGPGVKANFNTMMRWLRRGVPLPLGAIDNRRSFLALDNLVDLLIRCVDHPGAANRVFLAADGEDLSTPELLRRMGTALGHPARLLPVPVPLLEAAAALVGRSEVAQRLCSSLQADTVATRRDLQWQPPFGVDEQLRLTAQWGLEEPDR